MARSREIQYESSSRCSTFGVFVSFKDIRKLHRCFKVGRVARELRTWVESKLSVNKCVQSFKFATPVHDGVLYTELPLGVESMPIVWETYNAISRNPIKRMRVNNAPT